jgi:DNA recombination protein RmuC
MITGFLLGLAIGIIAGLALAFIFKMTRVKSTKELAEELYQRNEAERLAATNILIENLKASFGNISLTSLNQANEQLITLAKSRLETVTQAGTQDLNAKKGLIDQQLKSMTTQLENVGKLMNDLEKDRREKFGELTTQLKNVNEQTVALTQTTNSLREALASSRARGQWGERMAEDILQKAGFIETVNYDKQKVIEGDGSRPDFTFHLPNNLKLNMDVKFPLDNYLKFLNAGSDNDKEKCCGDFLRDVRARFK